MMLSELEVTAIAKTDYNTGVQLQPNNFATLYPVLHFDLRENKANDSKQVLFHYRLNEAATWKITRFTP